MLANQKRTRRILLLVLGAGAGFGLWMLYRGDERPADARSISAKSNPQTSVQAPAHLSVASGHATPSKPRVLGRNPIVEIQANHGVPVTDDPYEAPPPGTLTSEAAPQEPVPDSLEILSKSLDTYMMDTIAPRVRPCWKKLSGSGKIEFRYTFRDESGKASPIVVEDANVPVTIVESSLEPEQSRLALECMLDAVEGTSFPPGTVLKDPMIFKYQIWTVGKPGEPSP